MQEEMTIAQEEIFGPVMSLMKFKSVLRNLTSLSDLISKTNKKKHSENLTYDLNFFFSSGRWRRR